MAKYSAIGSMMYYRDNADRRAKLEEIALRRAMAKEQHELNKTLAQQKHDAEMAEIKARAKESAADRQFRKEESKADRLYRSTENAADRISREGIAKDNRLHEAEQKELDRKATTARDKFTATERAKAAKLKAEAESITSESVLSALNNTSYESSDKETKDASGGYKVFSLPAWIDGQVAAAVTAAENEAEEKTKDTNTEYNDTLTTKERRKEIIAEARERAGEKARVAATRAATEQANNVLAEMTLKAKQYVLTGKKPEDALKLVKKEFGSQSNSLFAKHFKPRQNPTTAKAKQKTPTDKTAETKQQGWFKSMIDNARTTARTAAKGK